MFNLFGNKAKEIEKAKQNLIHELEERGIKNLVISMDCKEPYSNLIKQRQLKEGSYTSEDNTSMIAYRVSSNLNNPKYKPELLELLSDPEYEYYKKYIFCCLSSLCSNINDYELFDFLLKEIENEPDENIVVSVLSRLDKLKKPKDKNLDIIKKFLAEGTSSIQQAAIKALANCEDEKIEELLLNEFKICDRHIKALICVPLLSLATMKSIPVLKMAHKETRDPFLKHQIEAVLDAIDLN